MKPQTNAVFKRFSELESNMSLPFPTCRQDLVSASSLGFDIQARDLTSN